MLSRILEKYLETENRLVFVYLFIIVFITMKLSSVPIYV